MAGMKGGRKRREKRRERRRRHKKKGARCSSRSLSLCILLRKEGISVGVHRLAGQSCCRG
jgi:hypothetical protein